ncbi:MAG TPA: TetR/AcrR family transcriptional regulator [Candidatus Acidoferrum sp.]|jgi:AcrR family transcriptional regulator|nr:TetR/AcrR family transcriptional regulator [Candidatus Acidoferrum sp.]
MASSDQVRPLRADARENREKLLAAAVAAFARSGVNVPLEAIAQEAGVGIGTLYRHFPTRDALVLAAYENEVQHLCEAAGELLAAMPPDAALREWMNRFVGYVAAKRGMADALRSMISSNALFTRTHDRMVSALSSLLRAAAENGSIRGDIDAEDVLRAMGGVWLVSGDEGWEEQAGRLLDLLIDGLRFRALRKASPDRDEG